MKTNLLWAPKKMMFNLIKKIFNRNKKVTPDIIIDRLLEGAILFIQHQKFDLNPRFTFIGTDGKSQPLYNINDVFPENIDIHDKIGICSDVLRATHIDETLQAAFIYSHGKRDEVNRIGARFVDSETPDCVIVDMQTPDGSAFVVVDYQINGDVGQIMDNTMYQGAEKIFFAPGQVYSRLIDDYFVFFKVLKVELDGIHILCYGNEVHDTKIRKILEPDEFHFEGSAQFNDFIMSLSERVNPEDGIIEFESDELYASVLGTCHVPGSHIPVSWSFFTEWDISRHTEIPVTDSELEGYEKWKSGSGLFFA